MNFSQIIDKLDPYVKKIMAYVNKKKDIPTWLKAEANSAKKVILKEAISFISKLPGNHPQRIHRLPYDEFVDLPLKTKQLILLIFSVGRGVSPSDAAAMIGNLTHESGDLKPLIMETGGTANMDGGFGLAQWTDVPRVTNLLKIISKTIGDPITAISNPLLQMSAILGEEGKTQPWRKKVAEEPELGKKTLWIMKNWERPNMNRPAVINSIPVRQKAAKDVYDLGIAYSNGTLDPTVKDAVDNYLSKHA